MKTLLKLLPAILLVIVIETLPSCKKSDPPTFDPSAIFQNKSWKLATLSVYPACNGITDIYSDSLKTCEKDDLYKFNGNDVFDSDNASVTWAPSDLQTHTGKWQYDDDNKLLDFSIISQDLSLSHNLLINETTENSFTAVEAYNDLSG